MPGYKIGTAFRLGSSRGSVYGVVMNEDRDSVFYCLVEPICDAEFGVRKIMYDDSKATSEHKDNVPLRHCPPPFSELCLPTDANSDRTNVYALADMSHLRKMDTWLFDAQANVIDNGRAVL